MPTDLPGARAARARPVAAGRRLLAALAALVALAGVLSGCHVDTTVSIDDRPGGRGVVEVTVSLDASTLEALGGEAALAAQLRDADLRAAGWVVAGPRPGPGSTTVITARHSYASEQQARALLSSLAGSGPAASRPFDLRLSSHHGWWSSSTRLSGRVDLTCGVACFGDRGLQAALGSPTGVQTGPLARAAGQQPGQVFAFHVTARLPGSLLHSDAASATAGVLRWTPRLGQAEDLLAVTRSWDWPRMIAAAAFAAAVILGLAGWLLWRRRGRRRRRRAGGSWGDPPARHFRRSRGRHARRG